MKPPASVPLATADELRQRLRRAARPKGRQPESTALAHVRDLIGLRPDDGHRRDLLIEHLHRINDAVGALPQRYLVALAHEMRLSLAEVYEVTSFYHHFDVIEDDTSPPRLTAATGPGGKRGQSARRSSPGCRTHRDSRSFTLPVLPQVASPRHRARTSVSQLPGHRVRTACPNPGYRTRFYRTHFKAGLAYRMETSIRGALFPVTTSH